VLEMRKRKFGVPRFVSYNRETSGREDVVEKIRWTLDYRLPRKLGSTREYNRIQIILLMLFPALLSSPILQGALDWKSSSEAAGQGMVATRNPSAIFWDWNFAVRGGGLTEGKWEAASLGSIIWDNTTSGDTNQPCRHFLAGSQFREGSRLINATLPCIAVHSVTWPITNSAPQGVEMIVDDVVLVSPSREQVFGFTPGTIALFDATDDTLPLPLKFGDGFEPLGDIVALTEEPPYPAPFLWSGVMTAIVLITKNLPYPPYRIDPFGVDRANNNISRGKAISFAMHEMQPERIFTHLQVNFTAGVVRPVASTYVRPNVVEAYANDSAASQGSGGILSAPWVREAIYMMSDTMNCMAKSNSTGVPTWHNLENYTSHLVRIAYISAWTNLQFKFEPNNTNLLVEIQEPRLQAVVERWRVVLWTTINVLFSCSWLLVRVLFKGKKEVQEVDGFADFVSGLYKYLEGKEPSMGDSMPLEAIVSKNSNRDGDISAHKGTTTPVL
jgi:hypothetical protein